MREVTKSVKTGKLVDGVKKQVEVGTVTCCVWENLEELQANETAEHILNMFNKQNVIRIQAAERVKHQEGRAGKGAKRTAAFNLLEPAELAKYAGNMPALMEFLDSEEMAARVEAATTAA